ncbi:gp53-like domain-containing protein [Escherichia coli]|uniref:gp53-like domain-containing protein n=1 Tax=Escherichia coli TaxID=562 RepID=UPI001BC9AA31|nr:hypothetical protein [Escherichia coli]
MAGTNDFKAFATDANANVTSQEEWETLTALKKGFSSGKASSAQVSKALRQPSTMAAVLGQFIANAELDALDDGDVDGLVAKLATAITTNLGLGEAAKRNVGAEANQIPDMSSFISSSGESGYQRLPGGRLIAWGRVMVSSSSNTVTLNVSFNNTDYRVVAVDTGAGCIPYGASPLSGSTFSLSRAGRAYDSSGTLQTITGPSAVTYIAIGN